MMNSRNKLEFKIVDQRNEGQEAWIRFENSDWIRLDFMLEFYLLKDVTLSKSYKGKFKDKAAVKRYGELFYDKFSKLTSGGEKFDFEKYLNWTLNNSTDLSKALKLMNS